ncbi:MAG: CAP domain-containing protein [Proteobacteria bacterium]|nr:CAP domain-containing protein [Pseudomonadota bacterium]
MDVGEWYYKETSGKHEYVRGPFTREALLSKLSENEIDENTLIRYDNKAWHPVKEYLPKKKKGYFKKYSIVVIIGIILILFALIKIYRQPDQYRSSVSTEVEKSDSGTQERPVREVLSKDAIISLTNITRVQNGIYELRENRLLNAIAEERVKDMFKKQYIGHVSPTGEGPSEVAQKVGYRYKYIGENIGSGMFIDNQKIINGWMQSPGHRQNLLSPKADEIGAAVLKDKMQGLDTWIAVQIFGLQSPPVTTDAAHRSAECIPPDQASKEAIDKEKRDVNDAENMIFLLKNDLEKEKAILDRTQSKTKEMVKGYNDKVNEYNQRIYELKEKNKGLLQMINNYNENVQKYNKCIGSR